MWQAFTLSQLLQVANAQLLGSNSAAKTMITKRYTAAVVCGLTYIAIGLVGAAVTGVLLAFPQELVMAIAGLALLGSIGGGLHTALKDDAHREAALITFLVTLSGVVIAGIGSAFWGVIAGALALFIQQYGSRKPSP
jgi:benzoate membrane transport protein